jgi:hypothetical protein
LEALHSYTKKQLKTTDLGPLFGPTPTLPTIPKPAKLPANADELEQMILKEEIKQFVSSTKDLKSNLAALHTVTHMGAMQRGPQSQN